ncbi:DUF433 domain-containing protein [Halosimplex halobium]|uniref:DUF433 domain-containing protein n=1 Tax=Halosimplex halobium TaxID=3396618 RepID=UPI003F542E45
MAQQSARIVATPEVLGGDPRIDDTRIGVYRVHELVETRGLEPQTVADRFDVDVADIYRALAYYHEHPGEMAAISDRREDRRRAAEDDPRVVTGPGDLTDEQE